MGKLLLFLPQFLRCCTQIHCGPSQPNYCDAADPGTLAGSTPMVTFTCQTWSRV